MEPQIKNFNAELDQVLAGEKEPTNELLSLAYEYANLDVTIPRIEQRRHFPKAAWRQRTALIAITAAIMVAVFWITPLSSFAQELIDRIGDLLFTGEPTWAERVLDGNLDAGSNLPPVIKSIRTYSLTKAQSELPYPLYLPASLPEGLGLPTYYVTKRSGDYVGSGILLSGTDYQSDFTGIGIGMLYISQHPVTENLVAEWAVGDAVISPIQVRETEGVFIEDYIGAVSYLPGGQQGIPLSMIAWEEAGFVFTITVDSTPNDKSILIDVAETLSPQVTLPGEESLLSLADAGVQAGFPAQTPGWLPDTYRLLAVDVIENDLRISIRQTYEDTDQASIIWIDQFRYPFHIDVFALYDFEDKITHETSVNDNKAVFVEDWFTDNFGLTFNLLVWQSGDDSFSMAGENLNLTEALHIAESLAAQ